MTDAEWWAQVRRQRDLGQQTAGPAQLALWRMTKSRHVAEAVIRRVPGIGLELRYALDGELRRASGPERSGSLVQCSEERREAVGGGDVLDAPGRLWRRSVEAGRNGHMGGDRHLHELHDAKP